MIAFPLRKSGARCVVRPLLLVAMLAADTSTASANVDSTPTGHRFAHSGAVAVECAFRANHGQQFVSSTVEARDSIGFWSWQKFASIAGIEDTAQNPLFARGSIAPETRHEAYRYRERQRYSSMHGDIKALQA